MTESPISIAFYNVENLFDIEDSPRTLDREFTPKGKKKRRNITYEKDKCSRVSSFSCGFLSLKDT